jgi:NADH-quinone oxidoreductase subunit N
MLAPVAVASMIAGNLLALFQSNLKRLLAYSSIAHLGYALVALLALPTAGGVAAEAVTFYLAAYFVTILGAFGIVTALSDTDGEAETIERVRGLFWRRPWLAALFTAMLLSLAGIPVTAGFLAKFYAAAAAVEGARWVLVLVLVLTSAIGLFYYLRVVVAMFSSVDETAPPKTLPAVAPAAGIALVALAVLLVWLGTWPAPVIDWIQGAVAGLL